MKIAFDVDDTLAQLVPVFLQWINLRRDTTLTVEDVVNYNLGLVLNCNDEEARKLVLEFYKSNEFKGVTTRNRSCR